MLFIFKTEREQSPSVFLHFAREKKMKFYKGEVIFLKSNDELVSKI